MIKNLDTPFDPWNARFAFFWYNDEEIFNFTSDDFDRKAKEYAERGINIVITFSCTHFRWSVWDYREQINKAIQLLVNACHKYDIRVVEHHSAVLTFNPLNNDDVEYAGKILSKRHSSLETWPEMIKHWKADRKINSTSMRSMRQIDGRTGQLARSVYHGWIMCPNNPDFRREYFAYLETVYTLGIDGIMTDDLHFMAEGHACACETCRKLFAEQTGYALPEVGSEWEQWYGNYNDPTFVAWKNFRYRSIENFHHAVVDHYTALGLKMLRPNYHSSALSQSWSAYCLETLPALDWVAVECCFSNIIRYAWGYWACEIAHKFMIGRYRKIPPGAYFYPDRPDTMLFSWGLCKTFGCQWIPTPEGAEAPDDALKIEAKLRKFEIQNDSLFRAPEKIARIGFFDSHRSRELYEHENQRAYISKLAWMHACLRRNIPFDMFSDKELTERLKTYKTIILNEVALLSEKQISDFMDFIQNGGNLIWVGKTGTQDLDGEKRTLVSLRNLMKINDFEILNDGAEIKKYKVGKGKIISISQDFGLDAFPISFYADRWQNPPETKPFGVKTTKLQKAFNDIESLLQNIHGQFDLSATGLLDDVLISMFYQPEADSIIIHLLNASGTFELNPNDTISHTDQIPYLRLNKDCCITIRKVHPKTIKDFKSVSLYEPICEKCTKIEFNQNKNEITVNLPAGIIREYGLIEIK